MHSQQQQQLLQHGVQDWPHGPVAYKLGLWWWANIISTLSHYISDTDIIARFRVRQLRIAVLVHSELWLRCSSRYRVSWRHRPGVYDVTADTWVLRVRAIHSTLWRRSCYHHPQCSLRSHESPPLHHLRLRQRTGLLQWRYRARGRPLLR